METVKCKPCAFFAPKRRNMGDNIQTKTTGRLTPCLQKKMDKTTYLVEVHVIFYSSCSPFSFASARTSSGQRELCTSPICAFRKKNMQMRD